MRGVRTLALLHARNHYCKHLPHKKDGTSKVIGRIRRRPMPASSAYTLKTVQGEGKHLMVVQHEVRGFKPPLKVD